MLSVALRSFALSKSSLTQRRDAAQVEEKAPDRLFPTQRREWIPIAGNVTCRLPGIVQPTTCQPAMRGLLRRSELLRCCKPIPRIEGPAANENAKLRKSAFLRAQQVVAPINQSAHRLLREAPRDRHRRATSCSIEPSIELSDSQRSDARRRKFDRQRRPSSRRTMFAQRRFASSPVSAKVVSCPDARSAKSSTAEYCIATAAVARRVDGGHSSTGISQTASSPVRSGSRLVAREPQLTRLSQRHRRERAAASTTCSQLSI